MKKHRIFRVDDRLIHGQVIEGWIKYFKLSNTSIVNDKVYADPIQQMIYRSVVPKGVNILISTIKSFENEFLKIKNDDFLVLFESIQDLYTCRKLIDDSIEVNIGCIANRPHKHQISDTVFLDISEIKLLCELREEHNISIKKLPWETSIEILNFNKLLDGNL
ncbi:MAG: PTS mannose/fructose/sorbose transporter subunit IIB [Calditerrivibrio nitroreducens]|uniref:PTS mannose/fructose/sorbose transporter subunit IIB n=1 Tax=Calditerrivibrio nitroreducens TaxID=477976 RepID=A0A2J6WG83_9BACT|nr:MAG: PTS mannose/fructose/sorbose transporter subunit IIB [Calditerrivibrio nitroreducens]